MAIEFRTVRDPPCDDQALKLLELLQMGWWYYVLMVAALAGVIAVYFVMKKREA